MQNMYSCVLFRTKENQYLHVKITLADIPACISTLYLLYLLYLHMAAGLLRTCACLSRLTRSRLVVRPTVLRCHWARSCTNHSSVLWVCGPIRGQYSVLPPPPSWRRTPRSRSPWSVGAPPPTTPESNIFVILQILKGDNPKKYHRI